MLVSELIKAALRKCGIYASGEEPTANELADGLLSLQIMLERWGGKNLAVFLSSTDTVTLVANEGQYTWGIGGTINSIRPYKIINAYITNSDGRSTPLQVRSEHWYSRVANKTEVGISNSVYYQMTYPLGTLFLIPVPEAADTLVITSLKPFTETGSFASIDDTLAFPPNYKEALLYGLTVRIAAEYGKPLTAEILSLATNSYNDLVTANAPRLVDTVGVAELLPIKSS